MDEEVEDLEKRYKASFSGPEKAGGVWFTPGGVTLAQVVVNFRELQLQELDKALRDYVRQVFNVSPELEPRKNRPHFARDIAGLPRPERRPHP